MFEIFKKLTGPILNDLIAKDLGRLDRVSKDLGTKAAHYVRTGDGGEVLSTLSNSSIDREVLYDQGYGIKVDKSHLKRQAFFLDCTPYDPPLMARYAEVLAAALPPSQAKYGLAGPATADHRLRIFFGDAFNGTLADTNTWPRQMRKNRITGLTPEQALAVGAELGLDPSAVLAILLWEDDSWDGVSGRFYRDLVDFEPFLAANAELLIKAEAQLNAQSRAALSHILRKAELAGHEPFLTLLLGFAGASAKKVREAALNALLALPADRIENRAIALLGKGNVATREGMIGLLGKLGTDSAIGALSAHLQIEKTARISASIDNILATQSGATSHTGPADQAFDDNSGYVAIDGSRVKIPPRRDLQDDPAMIVGPELRQKVEAAAERYNAEAEQINADIKKTGQRWGQRPLVKSPRKLAQAAIDLFNKGSFRSKKTPFDQPYLFLMFHARALLPELLDLIPLKRQIQVCLHSSRGHHFNLQWFLRGDTPAPVLAWLASDEGDLRVLGDILTADKHKTNLGTWGRRDERVHQDGDLVYQLLPDDSWSSPDLSDVSDAAIWPLLAENLALVDQALGLTPTTGPKLSRALAVGILRRMPKTPQRYFGSLLEIATGETKAGRAEARELLADVPEVNDRLIALLNDGRQAIRAGAAEWLAARGNKSAVKALKARLKKEKSELARAALLTALSALGEDLSSFVGPAALIEEAEAGLKKAKLDKLDWLDLGHLPKLAWANGKVVPDQVILWWLFVANKLKQPGGNALFEIYLDQLNPDSATTLSTWVFDSWLGYDSAQPSEEEGIAHAKAHVKQSFSQWKRWMEGLTEEATFQMLKRIFMANYLNSAAAFKGLLGLAVRVTPAHGAERVRHYLRNHGSRTSQATSLLEMLAAKGDPISLQVVIAAATRLKQKSVQAKAGEIVNAVAEARGWSMQELADRTIPTGGLDDDGIVELPCGLDEKLYQARLGDDLQLVLTNPDGKIVKALPGGDDDITKAAKKQLSTSRKEIKQVVKAQSDRLYEALCAERVWPVEDWMRDFNDHPVMRRLIERVVWIGLDAEHRSVGAFRPTSDGDFTDIEDTNCHPRDFAAVRLAHSALLGDEVAGSWVAHLEDYEVTPLFSQFGRPLLQLTAELKKTDEIADRKGWMTDAFTIRGAASKLGYDRGEALDGGFFCDYVKQFKSADMAAVIEFTGNGLPEENVPAALRTLHFVRSYSGYNPQKIPLKEVPPVLLSECWNDYHQMAAKAQFDPKWEKKVPW